MGAGWRGNPARRNRSKSATTMGRIVGGTGGKRATTFNQGASGIFEPFYAAK